MYSSNGHANEALFGNLSQSRNPQRLGRATVGARSQSLHTQRATATICPAEALAKEEAFRVVGSLVELGLNLATL
jgi:hypothetical protein